MTNVPRSVKKSQFTQESVIPAGATFDFVYNRTNYKLTVADMIAAFGTVGTIVQEGDPAQTPVLNVNGTENQIRNIEDGSGVKASISPQGGVLLDHNFQQGTTGAQILKDITLASPIVRTLVAGSGISIAEENGYIQIALSATPTTTKTVIVNELADFPTPVSGVITLEDNINYFLTNDISTSNRFVLGSNTVITGSDGTLITLTYTGTGVMFTSVDNSNKVRDLLCTCSSGSLIDISCSAGTSIFQLVNCNVTCDTIGEIDGLGVASFQNVIWAVTTDGFTFSNDNSIISFFQNIGSIAAGTFIDLGTSTFDGFSFTNSQGILAAGATFINGAADSTNVNTGGLATVINTRAGGAGAALSGVTTSDALWEFFGNNGIADSISSLLASHSGGVITISAANTPVIIDSTWTFYSESRFSGNANGVFTYTGKGAHVGLVASITADVITGVDDCTFYVYKNGVEETGSGITREFDSGDPGNLSLVWQLDLETNDTVSIYVENNDTTVNVEIFSATLSIK